MAKDLSDIVGPAQLAEKLGVKVQTVHRWRVRKNMPEPDAVMGGKAPVWSWSATIVPWAIKTDRLPADYVADDPDIDVKTITVELPSSDYEEAVKSVRVVRDQLNHWLAEHDPDDA